MAARRERKRRKNNFLKISFTYIGITSLPLLIKKKPTLTTATVRATVRATVTATVRATVTATVTALNSYSFWVLTNLCYNNVLHIINYVSCILYYIICTILYQIIYIHTPHKFIFVLSSHDIYLSHVYYFMSYETIYII